MTVQSETSTNSNVSLHLSSTETFAALISNTQSILSTTISSIPVTGVAQSSNSTNSASTQSSQLTSTTTISSSSPITTATIVSAYSTTYITTTTISVIPFVTTQLISNFSITVTGVVQSSNSTNSASTQLTTGYFFTNNSNFLKLLFEIYCTVTLKI